MTKYNCVLTNLKNFTDNINNDIINIIRENEQLQNIINELNIKIDSYEKDLVTIQEDYDNLKKVSYITSLNKQLHDKNNYIAILESQLNKYKNNKIIDNIDDKNILLTKNKKKQNKTSNNLENNNSIITPEIVVQDITENNIKKKKKHKSKTQVVEPSIEPSIEPLIETDQIVSDHIELENIIKKKHKKVSNDNFNPEDFEDVNGFELLIYKKTYYLRDLETNELYDILNNKQNNVVGLVNSKGKINFV